MKNRTLLTWIFIAVIATSCAKEVKETDDYVEERYLWSYMYENFPGVTPTASGLYFMPVLPTHQGVKPVLNNLLYARYTLRLLDSTIMLTTDDSLANMIGDYSYSNYYGPTLFSMIKGGTMIGLQEAFSYMAEQDKATAIVPSWLSMYTVGGAETAAVPYIYDLELLSVIPDIAVFQTDSLESYSEKHYGGVDSLKKDWYFISQKEGTGELPVEGDTMIVRYAGYLLDGFMFDSNIRDTVAHEIEKANKKWGGHEKISNTATYDSLTVIMKTDVTKMGVVTGFAYALQNMRDGSEAVTFFSSDYGYGSSPSGTTIYPYSMLRFYMKVRIGRVSKATN